MRFRNIYMFIFVAVTLAMLFLTDPDLGLIQNLHYGAGIVATLSLTLISVVYIALLHVSRKALLDYLDMFTLYEKARQTSQGAGLVFVGVSIVMVAIALLISAAVR